MQKATEGLQVLLSAVKACTQQRLGVLKERRLRHYYSCPIITADEEEASMPQIDNQVCFRVYLHGLILLNP